MRLIGVAMVRNEADIVEAFVRHNLKYGMVTMCVGTGMGAAGIFERV